LKTTSPDRSAGAPKLLPRRQCRLQGENCRVQVSGSSLGVDNFHSNRSAGGLAAAGARPRKNTGDKIGATCAPGQSTEEFVAQVRFLVRIADVNSSPASNRPCRSIGNDAGAGFKSASNLGRSFRLTLESRNRSPRWPHGCRPGTGRCLRATSLATSGPAFLRFSPPRERTG